MTQHHGRRFEHTLANGVDEITPREVYSTTAGYSGNSATGSCDIVVVVDPKLAVSSETTMFTVEAKKRNVESGKRCSTVFDGGRGFETGVEELQRFVDGTPSWADAVVTLKFDRRELLVLDARWILHELDLGGMRPLEKQMMDILSPRTTRSDNISMRKPTLENWPSATQSEDDAVVLCEQLGLPYDD